MYTTQEECNINVENHLAYTILVNEINVLYVL